MILVHVKHLLVSGPRNTKTQKLDGIWYFICIHFLLEGWNRNKKIEDGHKNTLAMDRDDVIKLAALVITILIVITQKLTVQNQHAIHCLEGLLIYFKDDTTKLKCHCDFCVENQNGRQNLT
jgi:hypothetical protein